MQKKEQTMLIDPSNHFNCLSIDDCMDGEKLLCRVVLLVLKAIASQI